MKKLISGSIAILLTLMLAIPSYAAINVSIDNQGVSFTKDSGAPFIDSSSRTQVPFRVTMEQFGCTVAWNQETQSAIAEKDGMKVEVPIGKKYILKNGQSIPNDTAALIKDGRTYLPIRAVLQAFGASVNWDAGTQTVEVAKSSNIAPTKAPIMTIHFIDVGQADSEFIDFGTFEILVDAGGNSDGTLVANYIKPYVDGDLELVLATHVHEDHIGGLDTILASYQVDKVIDSGVTATTATYRDYLSAVQSEPNCNYLADSDMVIDMGSGAEFKIIETGDGYSNVNDDTVMSMIDYNNIEVLLPGDAENDIESINMAKFIDVDILKAAHHGSSNGFSLLNVTKPETVIVSAGLGNTYGHPHLETLNRYFGIGASVYGTFKSGTIVVTTDGNTYGLNTGTKLTVADAGGSGSTPASSTTIKNDSQSTTTDSKASYIGNSNTHKFHLPTCSYIKSMSDSNKVFLKTREETISRGFIPCSVCKP